MYFQRRRGSQVSIYYRARDGKLKQVPRQHVQHLDAEPDHNVQAWINENLGRWEPTGAAPKGKVLSDSQLESWVAAWGEYRLKRGLGSKNTVTRACTALRETVIPYFLASDPPLTDPNLWASSSFSLVEWQERQGVSEANRIHARTALRKWWKWLGDTRRIQPGLELPLDTTRRTSHETTLGFSLTPDDVLAWVRSCTDERMRLMALIGYFASLRPQELFALRRCDFYAGDAVAKKECCLVMAGFGHFGRLAVDVHRQRRQNGDFEPPKAFSRGLVAIFNQDAATLIREILLKRDPEELLFEFKPNWNAELWSRGGIKGLTLHDLRKASIYWLGHHGRFDLIPLKNHARHSKVETTMLYCRRAIERAGEYDADLQW